MERFNLRENFLRLSFLALLFFSTVCMAGMNIDNIRINGNIVSSTNTNGRLDIDLNGSGTFRLVDLTATTVPYLNASKDLTSSAVTPTELGYLTGVTSAIQTQLNAAVTLTGVQAITNKDYDGGTASNSLRITVPKNTKANLDALNRKEGTIVYATDTDKVYSDDGATLNEMGAGGGAGGAGLNILSYPVDYNPDAEAGASTSWAETGGGALTVTSTAANVGFGTYAISYDSSANTDHVDTAAASIPSGLFGNNCLAEFYYKGFDSTITASVSDGSIDLITQALTAATTYTKIQLNFICPSSGTLQLRLTSSADAAIGYVDQAYIGGASNVSSVSQANFIGSAYIAAANCTPARTNVAVGTFSTDADCPGPVVLQNPGPGVIQTTDADLPNFTVNSLPPGYFRVSMSGTVAVGNGNVGAVAISDGTTVCPAQSFNGLTASANNFTVECAFSYTAAANRTFSLHGASSSGAITLTADSATIKALNFSIARFPTGSQLVADINNMPGSWSGFHDSTCSFSRTNTAFGDPAADASCAFTEVYNNNFGSVTSYLSGSDKLPGIIFTPKRVGKYFVCASTIANNGVSGATGSVRMYDGVNQISVGESSIAGSVYYTYDMCGIANVTSLAAKTISLQTKASSSSINIVTSGSNNVISWNIFQLDYAFPVPMFMNSVVSSSTGVTKIEVAKLNCDAGATIMTQHGAWVTSIGNVAAGACAVTLTAGTFSATPYCTVSAATTGGFSTGLELNVDATSSTAVSVDCEDDGSTACTAFDFILNCVGAR